MATLSSIGSLLGIDRAGVGFALRLAFAAWLAFAIAAELHVQNAYWAAMPIWVVAQSTRGLLLERSILRVVGTLIGAAFGLLVLHLQFGALMVCLLLGVWVAICSMLTHTLRGVHSYAALMAGMTAAIVAVPSMLGGDSSLSIAIARVECTLIGVVVVTLVTGLFTPQSPRQAFYRRVRHLCADAAALAADVLDGPATNDHARRKRQLLDEISEIDSAARLVSAGSVEGYRRLRHVDRLITSALAVIAAAQSERARHGEPLPSDRELCFRLRALAVNLQRQGGENEAIELGSITATDDAGRRLAEVLDDLVGAEGALRGLPEAADARSFRRKIVYLQPDRDWALAIRSGAVAGLAAFTAIALALATGNHLLGFLGLGVCIYAMVLAAMPVPQQNAPWLMVGAAIGVAVATLYRLFVTPHLGDSVDLVVSIAPFLLIGGFVRASGKTGVLGVEANMSFLMASQAGMPAAAPETILGTSAALLGAAILVGVAHVLVPRRPDDQAKRVAGAIRQDIDLLLNEYRPSRAENWKPKTSRQILRLLVHLRRAANAGIKEPDGVLAALNLGYAIIDLRGFSDDRDLPLDEKAAAQRALAVLRDFAVKPEEVASTLAGQARQSTEPDLAAAMRDASNCVRQARSIFGDSAK